MAHAHMAEMLDLDAEVLKDLHRDLITWVGSLAPDTPRIVDLGAGSGTGTIALARHLPRATVTAVDSDDEMLAHLRERADAAGVGDRVTAVRADLDQPWPDLGEAGVIWASASMHHLADSAAAVAQAFHVLRPGGVFAIVELESFPHFFRGTPDEGLEDRCHEAAAVRRAEHGMHMAEDWGDHLRAAGFAVEAHRRFDIDLRSPLPPGGTRYAQVTMARARHGLADRLAPADLEALDQVIAGIPDRDDLSVHTFREVWLGRRP